MKMKRKDSVTIVNVLVSQLSTTYPWLSSRPASIFVQYLFPLIVSGQMGKRDDMLLRPKDWNCFLKQYDEAKCPEWKESDDRDFM